MHTHAYTHTHTHTGRGTFACVDKMLCGDMIHETLTMIHETLTKHVFYGGLSTHALIKHTMNACLQFIS